MKNRLARSAWILAGLTAGCAAQDVPASEEPSAVVTAVVVTSAGACGAVTGPLWEMLGYQVTRQVTTDPATSEEVETYYTKQAPDSTLTPEDLGTDRDRVVTLYPADLASTSWTAELSKCMPNALFCGDGVRNVNAAGSQLCEGADLGANTCVSLGFSGGTLACTPDCYLDMDGCTTACGNGQVEPGEICEGSLTGDTSCVAYDPFSYTGGDLRCGGDCRLDTSACVRPICGDGKIELYEECDGATFGEVDTCAELSSGFSTGPLKCTDCRLDTSSCVTFCGNGRIDNNEECDGAARSRAFAGKSCKDVLNPTPTWPWNTRVRFRSGELKCGAGCTIDYSGCKPRPGCYGFGVIGIVCY